MRCSTALIGLVGVLVPAIARADDSLPPILRQAVLEQRLDEQVPLDLVFRDETGRTVRLAEFFDGKPVILVLAYFRCPMLCTQVLNGLVDSLRGVPFDIGDQFRVLTVSFDAREGPELAAAKKASYVESYGRSGAAEGWHFLTGDQASIAALTQAVGFHFVYDEDKDQFAHASGIMVLTPSGKISRYFYGIRYAPGDLRLALVEASGNKIGSRVDQVLLFCFHYDPNTGKYTPSVMNLVRLIGTLTLTILVSFLLRAWIRDARRRPRQAVLPSGS